MAFTRITVAGMFLDGDGTPDTDVRVVGQATSSMENTGVVEVNDPVLGHTDATGALVNEAGQPFTVAATGDTGTVPPGVEWVWTVWTGDGRVLYGRGPLSASPTTVDLFSLLDVE